MASLCDRIDEKGRGIFMSSHETLGVLVEEIAEYRGEVRNNDSKKQRDELLDIAVAALWGIVSLDSGKMDW
jgi:NTP pyrophosphatase (non-canonical NTP hydrolase)